MDVAHGTRTQSIGEAVKPDYSLSFGGVKTWFEKLTVAVEPFRMPPRVRFHFNPPVRGRRSSLTGPDPRRRGVPIRPFLAATAHPALSEIETGFGTILA